MDVATLTFWARKPGSHPTLAEGKLPGVPAFEAFKSPHRILQSIPMFSSRELFILNSPNI
jgi:hypothetical protein